MMNCCTIILSDIKQVRLLHLFIATNMIRLSLFKIKLAATVSMLLVCTVSDAQSNQQWSSYFGGTQEDQGTAVAVVPSGNIYVCGYSKSSGLGFNGFQNTQAGNFDAILIKFDPYGNRIWSTYYGSNGDDRSICMTTDDSGYVYIAGSTTSSTGIAYNGFQNTYGGGASDGFLAKFDSTGNRVWATYIGGTGGEEEVRTVEVDDSGYVYLGGKTGSDTGFTTPGSFQPIFGSGQFDAFLARYGPTGNREWCTYFGGSFGESVNDIAIDDSTNIYIALETASGGLGFNGFQNQLINYTDAMAVKFNTNGGAIWATYYGGNANDYATTIATDDSGYVYLAGTTGSQTMVAYNGFQNVHGGTLGTSDAFLVKFSPTCNRIWGTYYGDYTSDAIHAMDIDSAGNVYVLGNTYNDTGIAYQGFRNFRVGGQDCFIARFDQYGDRKSCTYLGGEGNEYATGLALDTAAAIYVVGSTGSSTYIGVNGFDNSYGGMSDIFVARYDSLLITGINEIQVSELNLFPNPAGETAFISGLPGRNYTFQIYDAMGRVLSSGSFTTSCTINLCGVSPGIVFLQITNEATYSVETLQLIKTP